MVTDGAEPNGELSALSAQRASDDDRETAVARIRAAAGSGLLDLDEVEHRLGVAYAAKTIGDLVPLVADLPTRVMPPTARDRSMKRPAFRDASFRVHFTIYVLTIGFLIGIWGLSGGGFFWPFFPAAGWAIALGPHYLAANAAQVRRERRLAAKEAKREVGPPDPKAMLAGTGNADAVHQLMQAAAPMPTLEPVRRFVVAMFVDVVGSTALNEALGDDGWIQVRDAFRATAQREFLAVGGWEVSTSGDGLFARFTTPNDAADAALKIADALAEQRAATGFAPTTRVGIHSGDALETVGGEDLIGSVINLAARVMSAAEPSEILVTEHVADHLDTRFVTVGRGLHELKGVSRPRHLLAVSRAE